MVPMTTWNDDSLMRELADAVGQEQDVPPHRRQAAYDAFTWRTVDAELLALTHDSALTAAAAVRGADDSRTLAFSGGGLSLELEIEGTDLTGQVLQAGDGLEVTMERADGESRTARTDVSGFFVLPDATGTVRFAVKLDGVGGTLRRTEWTVL
jgi:hypothetical protein